MIDPIAALATAAGLAIVLWSLALPEKGLVARLRRSQRNSQKELIEDALKHLYDGEYRNQPATIESVSGALGVKPEQAAKLLARLERLELIESRDNVFLLTNEGRSYALRVIRVHRLWERYFADETSFPETEWHQQAEMREHVTTAEEADLLARQTGNPLYDPHGDPIPTAEGKLPPRAGKPLTDLAAGELARIVHLEDEPAALYAQVVAEGIYPGMQVRVVEKSPERLLFVADGEEIVLAPVVASTITVEPLPRDQRAEGPFETLNQLMPGEWGIVTGLSSACRGMQRRRLMDLGVVPGTKITAELRSMSGNPTAYNIRGALIALRREQSKMIQIQRQEVAS